MLCAAAVSLMCARGPRAAGFVLCLPEAAGSVTVLAWVSEEPLQPSVFAGGSEELLQPSLEGPKI